MAPETTTATLLVALGDIYRAEGREAADRTARALMDACGRQELGPNAPCALDAMIRALAAESPHPGASAILAAQNKVPWGINPVADKFTPEIEAICAVATLMGPEGPILEPDLRLGLFYQRPHCYYPLHNHDADETYVILAGRAFWTAGEDRRMRGPGDMIHHPSLMPHAFRTGPEGFLALWRWSGDVNTHSYTYLSDPEA